MSFFTPGSVSAAYKIGAVASPSDMSAIAGFPSVFSSYEMKIEPATKPSDISHNNHGPSQRHTTKQRAEANTKGRSKKASAFAGNRVWVCGGDEANLVRQKKKKNDRSRFLPDRKRGSLSVRQGSCSRASAPSGSNEEKMQDRQERLDVKNTRPVIDNGSMASLSHQPPPRCQGCHR